MSFIVDFYCHKLFLVIEIDGSSHDYKLDYDIARQQKLEHNYGLTFLRFRDIDVKTNMFNVLLTIQDKVDELEC